jgi:flagellar protein FlaJ
MSSIKSSRKPNEKASSKADAAKAKGRAGSFKLFGKYDLDELFTRDPVDFDLLSQLTHMAAVSTAGMSRASLFEGTAGLSYSTSKHFRQVHLVARRLNYDYSRACELVAETVKDEAMKTLLLHFATSLSSGEKEQQFLEREAALQRETYGKEYERKIESLQKWSDAYVAIMVSATLVVVISLVSMMIYPFSPIGIIGLAGLMVCVTFVGGWLILTVAPVEMKTHKLKYRSTEQERANKYAKFLLPIATVAGLGLGWPFGLAAALIVVGVIIAPVGVVALLDDWKIDARDRDIGTFIRALGSVMDSAGISVSEALSRLNRRALGSLEPLVRRLFIRLKNGIAPDLSWLRLAAESGSEVVTRSVRIFWDGVRTGGDIEKVSTLSSEFSLKISLLRADRKLVATTFGWVVVPLHAVLLAILLFVTEVVQIFGAELAKVQDQSLQGGVAAEAGVSDVLLFQFPALDFVPVFVGTVALMLTAANSFAPYAAAGGHKLKLCFYGAIMLIIAGIVLIVVPHLVHAVFENVATTPTSPTVAPTPASYPP